MRGNEAQSRRLKQRHRFMFPIPMRGNERTTEGPAAVVPRHPFPIPMRGNEYRKT